MLDIGTNGELVLGNKDRLVCCSTAAGPAFEGAKIHCGMRGAQGAVDHMTYDPSSGFHFTVIGQEAPEESAVPVSLIPLPVCACRAHRRIRTAPEPEEAAQLDPAFASHMAEWNHMPAFLYDPAYPEVFLTQRMSGKYSWPKAPLQRESFYWKNIWALPHDNIRKVYIAGAFGNYMDPKSACDIGLLPYSSPGPSSCL